MARPGLGRLTLPAEAHEPALRGGLLAFAADALAGDMTALIKVVDILINIFEATRAEPLWRASGSLLARALRTELRAELLARVRELLADDMPAWRLQPLSGDPEIAALLLARLAEPAARARVAAIRGLAPQVHDPAIRRALVVCLDDAHAHAQSTAVEVLRPVATEPEVRDALLALLAGERPLPGAVDRALRRSLRVAAADLGAATRLLAELHGRRAWIAAHALAGAVASEAHADALLAALARDPGRLTVLWPAFVPVAQFDAVAAAFVPRLAGDSPSDAQQALRIVGLHDGEAARAATLRALEHPANYVRWGAVQQLARRLDRPEALAAVRARLRDEDDGVRMYAVQALAAVDDPAVQEQLRGMLADPSPAVAVAAAGAVARRTPDPAAWQVLAPYLGGGVVHSKSWQPVEPRAQLGTLLRLDHVRDAVAAELGAYAARSRAAAAKLLKDADPSPALAERLARCIRDDAPPVASAAYDTLLAWAAR